MPTPDSIRVRSRYLAFSLAVATLSGCVVPGEGPRLGVTLKLPTRTNVPESECVFISVSGPGIVTGNAPAGYDKACFSFGKGSSAARPSIAKTTGLTLQVPIGKDRRFGVVAVSGVSSCDGQSAEALIASSNAAFREVGSTTRDITAETVVRVAETANDRLMQCRAAGLTISGDVNFGEALIGGRTYSRLVLTNGLSEGINLTPNGASGPFTLASGGCGMTLNAGEKCAFEFSFAPSAAGPFSDQVSFRYGVFGSGGASTQFPIAVSGTGVSIVGTLDGSFAGSGFTSFSFNGGVDELFGFAMGAAQKLFFGGRTDNPSGNSFLSRLTSEGGTDAAFSPIFSSAIVINALVVDEDNDVVYGAGAKAGDLILVNYTLDGAVRPAGFGTSGVLQITPPSNLFGSFEALALSNGKLFAFAGGYTPSDPPAAYVYDLASNTGAYTYASSYPASTNDYRVKSAVTGKDGHVYVGGSLDNSARGARELTILRFNPNGTFQTSFGGATGYARAPQVGSANGYAVAIDRSQTAERIVIAGDTTSNVGDVMVARFLATGGMDTSFNTNGYVVYDAGGSDAAKSVGVQVDGKVVVAAKRDSRVDVVRFTESGAVDATGFGSSGVVTYQTCSSQSPSHLALRRDGRIVVAGNAVGGGCGASSRPFVLRLK